MLQWNCVLWMYDYSVHVLLVDYFLLYVSEKSPVEITCEARPRDKGTREYFKVSLLNDF